MINAEFINEWRPEHPWSTPAMVEQDLVITRALVSIFSDDFLRETSLSAAVQLCINSTSLPSRAIRRILT